MTPKLFAALLLVLMLSMTTAAVVLDQSIRAGVRAECWHGMRIGNELSC
jgi:hypothetical protein